VSKIRVYELAKELGVKTKDFLTLLKEEFDIEVNSHMSTLEDSTVDAIRELLDENNKKEVPEEEKKETPKEEKKPVQKKYEKPQQAKKNKSFHNKSTSKPVEKIATKSKKEEEDLIKEITISPKDLKLDKLCSKIKVSQNDVIKTMFMKKIMLRPGQIIDFKTAEDIALNYNTVLTLSEKSQVIEKGQTPSEILKAKWDNYLSSHKEKLKTRPSVVTVMGHVDHGKTTLLDSLRDTNVAEKEAGGITQSIGAYQIEFKKKKITFIDTPGHEAFTEMRARGAQATDIVILIIAADDGVMPQTIEAFNHAKDAKVPIIVAINKIDKPNANVDLTKQQMVAKLNLVPEDWGGDTITVPISAISGKGIEELLEMILLVSEVEEIKGLPKGNARGLIIESKLDKFLGPVATIIVKDGILKQGDFFVSGSTYGKVRRLIDDKGKTIKQALPSTPVQVLGFEEVPDTHAVLYVVKALDEARSLSQNSKEHEKEKTLVHSKKHVKLEEFMKMMEGNQKKNLNIILKAGTFGEIEALRNSINKLKNEDVDIDIVHAGIGAITSSDIMLATASDAVVMGFRVKADSKSLKTAEKEGIQVKKYDIIFNLIDDIKKALQGMLEPEEKEEITGSGEIKEVFKIKKVGSIAGIQLLEGSVFKAGKVRIYRNGKLLNDVKIESLKHYKDEVKMVDASKECGIKFENYDDVSAGDELEFYKMIQVEREIDFKG
jgi:translation initiation factor IF-2